MNFLRPLAALCLGPLLQAQALDLQAQGGGDLKIGGLAYRFELGTLYSAPPKGGLPGAIRIRGRLVPEGPSRPWDLDMTLLKSGVLYMLRISRKGSDGYPDSWAATLKTRIQAISLHDGPGGRVEVACLGTLSGVVARRPRTEAWQGRIWAIFPGEAVQP